MAIEQDVAQLMQWMQSVKSNAKETHEFNDIGEVNNQTLIRLAKLGQSYKIGVEDFKRLVFIDSQLPSNPTTEDDGIYYVAEDGTLSIYVIDGGEVQSVASRIVSGDYIDDETFMSSGVQVALREGYLYVDGNSWYYYDGSRLTTLANANIYNSDGAIDDDRTVDVTGKTLKFQGDGYSVTIIDGVLTLEKDGNIGVFDISGLTDGRNWQLPDKSGVIALLDDLKELGGNEVISFDVVDDDIELKLTDNTTFTISKADLEKLLSLSDYAKTDDIPEDVNELSDNDDLLGDKNVQSDLSESDEDSDSFVKNKGKLATKDKVDTDDIENEAVTPGKLDREYAEKDKVILKSEKGEDGGVAPLNSAGKIPSRHLPEQPSNVVIEDSYNDFPNTGEENTIYIDRSTGLQYVWDGNDYVQTSTNLSLGETSSTAYRGDRGKEAYEHSKEKGTNPHEVTKSDVGLSNVVNKEQLGKDETAADSNKLGGKDATEYSTKIWVENKGYLVEDDLPDPIDISGKEDTSNKATNLENPNDTKYPTTKAVSDELENLELSIKEGLKKPQPLDPTGGIDYPEAEEGDTWRFTANGKVGDIDVETGDMLVAKGDSNGGDEATAGTDFFILQANIDQATEEVHGFAKVAKESDLKTNDDKKFITPKKLEKRVDDLGDNQTTEVVNGQIVVKNGVGKQDLQSVTEEGAETTVMTKFKGGVENTISGMGSTDHLIRGHTRDMLKGDTLENVLLSLPIGTRLFVYDLSDISNIDEISDDSTITKPSDIFEIDRFYITKEYLGDRTYHIGGLMYQYGKNNIYRWIYDRNGQTTSEKIKVDKITLDSDLGDLSEKDKIKFPDDTTNPDYYVKRSEIGENEGVAPIGSNGKVPAGYLPDMPNSVVTGTYVDSTTFKDSQDNTVTPQDNTIYVDATSGLQYAWSGAEYVQTSSNLSLGETSTTAYRGDRGKIAYDHSQEIGTNPHEVTKSDVGLGNVKNKEQLGKNETAADSDKLGGRDSEDIPDKQWVEDKGYITSADVPKKTSELTNDGEGGKPFITEDDIPDVDINTDESLYFDETTRELRTNITSVHSKFTYTGGDQTFNLPEEPVQVVFVMVNGQYIENPDNQYVVDSSEKTITFNILQGTVDNPDFITVYFKSLINANSSPFPTYSQVEDMIRKDSSSIVKSLDYIREYGTDASVLFIKKNIGRYQQVIPRVASFEKGEGRRLTKDWVDVLNKEIVINAGTSDNQRNYTRGIVITKGKIQSENEGVHVIEHPSQYVLGIDESGFMKTWHIDSITGPEIIEEGYFNATSAFTPLIKDGQKVDIQIIDDSPHATSPEPRQMIGVMPNGDYLVISCNGRESDQRGWTNEESANIMLGYGVDFGYMLDGGGSVNTYVYGEDVATTSYTRPRSSVIYFERV